MIPGGRSSMHTCRLLSRHPFQQVFIELLHILPHSPGLGVANILIRDVGLEGDDIPTSDSTLSESAVEGHALDRVKVDFLWSIEYVSPPW